MSNQLYEDAIVRKHNIFQDEGKWLTLKGLNARTWSLDKPSGSFTDTFEGPSSKLAWDMVRESGQCRLGGFESRCVSEAANRVE